jgi:EEF1A N-terminal glycine/lysine methyltransferase
MRSHQPHWILRYALHPTALPPLIILIVELDSGTALPSLLASRLTTPPALVVVTDYPDDLILNNLQSNVDENFGFISPNCAAECRGYEWGEDPSHLP